MIVAKLLIEEKRSADLEELLPDHADVEQAPQGD